MKPPPRKGTIFSLLDQRGPFGVAPVVPGVQPFRRQTKAWVDQLHRDGLLTTYRVARNQIFDFLNITSFGEIGALTNNPGRRRAVRERAYLLLGNMFGIEGTPREIIGRVQTYAATADKVINSLKRAVFPRYAPFIEITNEIEATASPADLLLILFDPRYHHKARFEAKRKLILMNLAGSIDQREREMEIERRFAEFLDFLNDHVWSRDLKIGELSAVYLVSRHDPESFACREVRIVDVEEGRAVGVEPGTKRTLVKRRRFRANGREVPIYVSIRKKPPETKVLKLLRKGEENPAVAVEDELGLMAVLDSIADVQTFQKHLTRSAIKGGSFLTLEEITDTLSGRPMARSGVGSSPKTAMFKFFARMGGMRVEFIVHTNETYLNYLYQRDVAHDEYEVKRILDSGVAELLFPQEIYGLDFENIREDLLRWCRKLIEDS